MDSAPSTGAVYVRSIAYVLGRILPIADALVDRGPPDLLAKLLAAGFRSYSVSELSAPRLAREALAATLTRSERSASSIDAVVYATCSFWGDSVGELHRASIHRDVLAPLGLDHVALHGVGLAESGNFASALRTARNLLRCGDARNVLVVTTDRVPNRTEEYRAMPSAVTINSDGAAACLVSSEPGAGFELEEVAQVSSPKMLLHRKGEGLQKYLEIVAGLRAAFDAVRRRLAVRAEDYAALVTNNYAPATLANFAQAVGVVPERVFIDNVARFGHAFAADNLINIDDLCRSGGLRKGDRLLALSTGPLTWGAVSLRQC
ncbi:MAG: 3-oxoacyl-[acyl-carrier-protein] synthase III C-terminal domain-containing protein [Polyangiaceae bacterium]